MGVELIKLKVKRESSNKEKSDFIKIKFIEACEKLDASIFEPLINEEQYFQDLDKYRFLSSLKEKFDFWKGEGVYKATLIEGACEGCHWGYKSYQFYTNDVKPAFAYVIQENEEEVIDIFECNLSSGMSVVDFKELSNYSFWRKT